MTAPVVGQVAVEVVASASALAKSLRKEVESAFKDLDLNKLIRDSIGKTPVKVPVSPDVDTDAIPEKVRRTRAPKIPVEVDPLLNQFQQQVRRQVAALARQVNANIPVGADTEGLRAELRAQLQEIQAQSRLQIPTEPGAKAEYEAKLRALVAEASAKVKANVKVDVDKSGFGGFGAVSGLFKSLIPDITGVGGLIRNLASGVQQFAAQAAQGGSQLAAGVAQAAGPVGTIVSLLASAAAAMGALSGAAILAVPALTAVAGAAAAIPAALSGLGAAVGTLGLGFKGIGEAFKPAAGGGGGGAGNQAAQQARQVAAAARQVQAARRGITAANRQLDASERSLAAAERGVEAAQRNLVDAEDRVVAAQKRAQLATEAISRARREATEDIEDLNRSLAGARLSEEDAALGVEEALRALNEVKLTGNIPDIKRADLAYRQALQTLDEARDTTSDLTEQTDEANTKGVEGSDKVQSALQDQADALDGVKQAQEGVLDAQNGLIDATDSLKSAQDGVAAAQDGIKSAADGLASALDSQAAAQEKVAAGAGGLAKQLTKLAPAAQKFVDAVKALKPAFEDLRLDVQQRLFEGLDKTVTHLGDAWIPALKTTLGNFADTFNGFFRDLGTSITTPKFISDIQAGAEGARQGLSAIGSSITDSLVPAFGALSKAAGPFLKAFGDEIAQVVTDFSNWVLQGEKTGGLSDFFDRAKNAMHDIFTTGKLVTAIIGDLFTIITGSQEKGDEKSALDSFNDGLQKVHDFLQDPKNQQQIRDMIADVKDALIQFGSLAKKVDSFIDGLNDKDDKAGSIGDLIGRALIAGIIAGMKEGILTSGDVIEGLFKQGVKTSLVGIVMDTLGVASPSKVFAEIGRDLIRGLVQGMQNVSGLLVTAGQAVKTTVVNAVSGPANWLLDKGRQAAGGLANGIKSLFPTVAAVASNLRPTVQNPLARDASTLLYSSGQAMGIGLARGLQSTAPALGATAANIAANVANKLNAALGIRSPSKVTMETGRFVGEGLALGMQDRAAQVEDAAAQLAAAAVPPVDAAGFADVDAAISRSLNVSGTPQLLAKWKDGATGDKVLDAFRDLIEFSFNGDPVAALGS